MTTLVGGGRFAGCQVGMASTSSANLTGNPNLTWNKENYDTHAFHSTATNTDRLVVPAGFSNHYFEGNLNLYLTNITADQWVALSVVAFTTADVVKAVFQVGTEIGNVTNRGSMPYGPIKMSSGEYFVARGQVESDTNVTLNSSRTFFSIKDLGTT